MTILLTGADTLFGTHLARELSDGGFPFRAITAPGTAPRIDGIPFESSASFALDLESCISALAGVTAVFHLESERLLSRPLDEPAAREHVEGTRNLLVAMTRCGVEDVVYASSAMSFSPGSFSEPGDESSPAPEVTVPCLRAMRAVEDLLQRYCDDGRLRYVTLHPTLMMGAGASAIDPCWWFVDRALSGGLGGRAGGVNVVRASDAAPAAIKVMGRGRPSEALILAGENLALADLAAESLRAADGFGAHRDETPARPAKHRRRSKEPPEPLAAMLATEGLYYSPAKARERLDLEVSPAAETIAEAVAAFFSPPAGDGA